MSRYAPIKRLSPQECERVAKLLPGGDTKTRIKNAITGDWHVSYADLEQIEKATAGALAAKVNAIRHFIEFQWAVRRYEKAQAAEAGQTLAVMGECGMLEEA